MVNAPAGIVNFETSVVQGNESGISFTDVANTQIGLSGTVIRDNAAIGLYFEGCDAAITGEGSNRCQLQRNGVGISSRSSRLQLADLAIEDCADYGVFASDSEVSLRNSTVSGVCGVYVDSSNLAFTAEAVRFRGGADEALWGLVHSGGLMEVSNCIVEGFPSGIYAGGHSSRASILNSTLANSTAYGVYVAGGEVSVKNTILAGSNGQYGVHRAAGTLNHSHNLVHGFATPFLGTTAQDSEIVKPPRFVDAASGDFRLAVGSPAINGGDDLSSQLLLDIAGSAGVCLGPATSVPTNRPIRTPPCECLLGRRKNSSDYSRERSRATAMMPSKS